MDLYRLIQYRRILRAILVGVFSFGLSGSIEGANLTRQETRFLELRELRDSLLTRRERLVASVDSLAALIDGLKRPSGGIRAEGRLADALQASLVLIAGVEKTDRAFRRSDRALRDHTEQLRQDYDKEIGRLIEGLDKKTSAADLTRLKDIQKSRARLTAESPARVPADSDLPILRTDDGPRVIRQKAQLFDDVAAQLDDRSRNLDRQLSRLKTESRLRKQSGAFSSEMALFDETLPDGRAVSPSGAAEGERPTAGTEIAAIAPVFTGGGGRTESTTGEALSETDLSDGNSLQAQIQRLQAERDRLRGRTQALQARADSFRTRAKHLIENAR